MTLSNEWYNTELENSELETLHRSPTVEYSFYNAVRSGDMEAVIKTVPKMNLFAWKERVFYPVMRLLI